MVSCFLPSLDAGNKDVENKVIGRRRRSLFTTPTFSLCFHIKSARRAKRSVAFIVKTWQETRHILTALHLNKVGSRSYSLRKPTALSCEVVSGLLSTTSTSPPSSSSSSSSSLQSSPSFPLRMQTEHVSCCPTPLPTPVVPLFTCRGHRVSAATSSPPEETPSAPIGRLVSSSCCTASSC